MLLERMLVNKISSCFTGKEEDLMKLVDLGSVAQERYGLKNFVLSELLEGIGESLKQKGTFGELFLRVGRNLSPSYRKRIISNLIYYENIKGLETRNSLTKDDNIVPAFIVISPTMRCNLSCHGCYSGLYDKHEELSYKDLDKLVGEARSLGIHFIVISGGEPYIIKEDLLKLFKKYRDVFFLTYTNGTLIDEKVAKTLAKLGNVAPAISVEGFEEETDARRGKGTYQKIIRAMKALNKEGVLFGFSATNTKKNMKVLTSDEFVKHYMDLGAIFGWYFIFMPVGKDPDLSLVLSPEERVYAGKRVAELRDTFPMFLADFWNDGDLVGGCLAGGRLYLHILNSGNVEPCVFAHFSSDNIREKSLYEAANSDFFKGIRKKFPYNDSANLKMPCMIIDNPNVLRSLVDKYVIPSGHKNSDAIIHDKNVVAFVDEYSQQMKDIVEPGWKKRIQNPKDRWYYQGEEYKTLFKNNEKN